MLDQLHVQALAARRGDPFITSLYLDVDGRRYPRATDFQPHVADLCRAARRRAAFLDHGALASADADLERICAWLDQGIDRATTRGVAVFCCTRQEYFEPLLLPVPVRDQVSIEPAPNVAALLAILENRQRSLVVLVDGRVGRIVRIELGVAHEQPTVIDEPERQVDTDVELGSWQHRREEQKRRHFRRVASAVLDEVREWHPDHLVLGGPGNDVGGLRACLDRAVALHVAGTISLPMTASGRQIAVAIGDLVRNLERQREEALVEELQRRAAHGRAVLGMAGVMAALGQRRVEALIIARGFQAVGARCPMCGHIGVAACQCPECGTPSVEVDDLVDVAINRALAQSATVEFCDSDLDVAGGVAALERF